MSLEQKTQSLRRQSVELLKKIDDRSGDFGRSNYLGMSELLREPFMADVSLSREDIQNAFLARRLDQMMRLPMDSSDEKRSTKSSRSLSGGRSKNRISMCLPL